MRIEKGWKRSREMGDGTVERWDEDIMGDQMGWEVRWDGMGLGIMGWGVM